MAKGGVGGRRRCGVVEGSRGSGGEGKKGGREYGW